ncbi:MAG: lipocalin family protein [Bacteroidia bacterium]
MKKVFASIAIVALLVGSVSVTGCGKYEEGPSLSLRTKKARIVGQWEVEKVMENGVDVTSDYRAVVASETIEFKKDETFTASTTLTSLFGGATDSQSGTWAFAEDKEKVSSSVTENSVTTTTTVEILRLTNKEFWTKEVDGSDTYEYHYKSK